MTSASPAKEKAQKLPVLSIVELAAIALLVAMVYLTLSPFWDKNPSYQFAYLVPFISAYLIFERFKFVAPRLERKGEDFPFIQHLWFWSAVGICMLLFMIMGRLLLEVAMIWRPGHWLFLIPIVVGVVLWAYMLMGRAGIRYLIFPVLFLLFMLPWPGPIELWTTQGLMRLNTFAVTELLNLTGTPAYARGNVIDLPDGPLGVVEACSGIRSLQASIMLAVFFGAFCELSMKARWQLLFIGIGLAMAGNLCRTFILGLIGAKAGNEFIETYHDAAGYSVLVFTFIGLATVARMLEPQSDPILNVKDESKLPDPEPGKTPAGIPLHLRVALVLGISALMAEGTTRLWFGINEPQYTDADNLVQLTLPKDLISYQENEISPRVTDLLGYTTAVQAAWKDAQGRHWNGFIATYDDKPIISPEWREGWAAHRPEICFPANGLILKSTLGIYDVSVNRVPLASAEVSQISREMDNDQSLSGSGEDYLTFTAYRYAAPGSADMTAFFNAQLAGGGTQTARHRRDTQVNPWFQYGYYAKFFNLVWEGRRKQDAITVLLTVDGMATAEEAASMLRVKQKPKSIDGGQDSPKQI